MVRWIEHQYLTHVPKFSLILLVFFINFGWIEVAMQADWRCAHLGNSWIVLQSYSYKKIIETLWKYSKVKKPISCWTSFILWTSFSILGTGSARCWRLMGSHTAGIIHCNLEKVLMLTSCILDFTMGQGFSMGERSWELPGPPHPGIQSKILWLTLPTGMLPHLAAVLILNLQNIISIVSHLINSLLFRAKC